MCQPSVPSIKEGSKATTSDQLEELEHIHTLQTFQDGRAPSLKENLKKATISESWTLKRPIFVFH